MRATAFLLVFLGVIVGVRSKADDILRDLCPDRPGKDTSACTVDAGHFQIESDLVDGSFQHAGGVTTDTWLVADTLLKYGVSDDVDAEIDIPPLVILRAHDSRTTQVLAGFGDVVLRAKWAAIGNSGSDFAFALDPFLKLPTARNGIGNGAVEGGVAAPIAFTLPGGWSLGSTPEIDILKDTWDDGDHANVADVVSLGRNVSSDVSLGAEVWEDTNFDPATTTEAWSLDLVAAWLRDSQTQLDAGVNLGLNRHVPGVEAYCGYSRRF